MTNEQMDEFGNVVRNVFDVKQPPSTKAPAHLSSARRRKLSLTSISPSPTSSTAAAR
jgi:hypothetical protein